jgi:hypothetical protein
MNGLDECRVGFDGIPRDPILLSEALGGFSLIFRELVCRSPFGLLLQVVALAA